MDDFSKIIKAQKGDIKFAYIKNNNLSYLNLFYKFLSERNDSNSITSNDKYNRFVYLFKHENKSFVFKIDGNIENRLERKIIKLITGDFYFNLINKLSRVSLDKCDITYEIYLVAFNVKTKEHYIISNWLDGRTLNTEDVRKNKSKIKECVEKLHSYGLVSNDIHEGNFILSTDGKIRLIDLTDCSFVWLTKANDAIELSERFDIKIKAPLLAILIKSFTKWIKKSLRKIRGK